MASPPTRTNLRAAVCGPRTWISLGLLLLGSLMPGAVAQADGVYGRFAGDTTGAVGLGGGALFRDGEAEGALSAEVRIRFLDAAGPFLAGTWVPGGGGHLILGRSSGLSFRRCCLRATERE